MSVLRQIQRFLGLGSTKEEFPQIIKQAIQDRVSELDLSEKGLTELPVEIGRLSGLISLDLSKNELRTLPPEIGQLINLARLNLSENQLSTLPVEIQQLVNLTTLDLRGNPLPIPPEILERINDPATIIDCLPTQARRKPLNEAKMVIVGDGGVGKTSLVKRLIENQFDSQEAMTQGISIKSWRIRINDNDQPIRLNLWDFGGQEIMHATHQFFMSTRSLYLLVLDARREEADSRLDYWLKLIQSFAADSPIIIVSNKIDQHELILNQRELIETYPTIKAFVSTSCKTGQGIPRLKSHIRTIINQLPHVHDEIPLEWLQLKAQLRSLEGDNISYSDYVRFSRANNINSEREQGVLIGLLHDLGVVLNFQDDPRLRGTAVLNPTWVTDAVYRIINAPILMQSQGILQIEQLDEILEPERYPREKHLFIIDLMRKFGFCFDLEGHTEERFLIPDLLPAQEPELDWLTHDSLNLEYHYDFLPRSVISRFMVQMQRFIFQDTYWRYGVLLVNNQNRALVKALPSEKKIVISIIGEPQGRRLFLTIMREQFESIHASIKDLNAQAKISLPKYKGVMIDYNLLLNLQKRGINEYPLAVGDDVEIVNVPELLEGMSFSLEPTEQKEITTLKESLTPLRLRVHPQKYYPIALSLGQLYYNELADYTSARQALVNAHEAIGVLRSLIGQEADQVRLSGESVKLYEMLVSCYLQEGDEVKAFEYAAVGKGRAFINKLAEARIDLESIKAQKPEFSARLEQIRLIRHQIDQSETQITLDNSNSSRWATEPTRLIRHGVDQSETQIASDNSNRSKRLGEQSVLLRQEAELWREMEREYPLLTATLSVPSLSVTQAITLAKELQATLVEYYCHAGGWCAFVVTSDGVRYVPLPNLDDNLLEELVDWRNHIHLSTGRTPIRLRRLATLYEAAVAPLRLASERVIIAPFRELHLLPLSPTYYVKSSGEKCYLAEEHILSYVPSLTALYVTHQEQKRRQSSNTFERLLSVAYPGTPPLSNVLEQAQAITSRLSNLAVVDTLREESATPAKVLRTAQSYDIIHFGCHERFDSTNPTQSGLHLAEGFLTIQRILTELNLKQTSLVTLGTCLTGAVRLRDGEEHVGFLQAMMVAGAQVVMANQWVVDDPATRALFTAFYNRLLTINEPARAMRDAIRLLRTKEKWAHPYYWAAFQVNGLTYPSEETAQVEWSPGLLKQIDQDYQQSIRIREGTPIAEPLNVENVALRLKDALENKDEVTELDLSRGRLSELPSEIGTLTNLRRLILDDNILTTLPKEIGNLHHLRELRVRDNGRLAEIPHEIWGLEHLEILDFSRCQISSISKEIQQLTSLKELSLWANPLDTMPSEVFTLSHLRVLNLRQVGLEAIPEEISHLIHLETLDLRDNKLERLPEGIRTLPNLKELYLHNNPLPIPEQIIERMGEPAAIIEYYFQARNEPLNEAKLVLVGQGGVGKTSLVKRLLGREFDKEEKITEGINIEQWSFPLKEEQITANIWDFGGQEIMHATHKFFLTRRTLYLLVLDARQGEVGSRIDYWLKVLSSYGANCPIIVVSNKCDLLPLDLNRRGLRIKYPDIKKFVETSCETGKGIEELKKKIIDAIDNLTHVRDLVPPEWRELKSELAKLEKDYIPYEEYEHLCQAKGINDKSKQKDLIGLLHDLGQILNFHDDAQLRNIGVLNPKWITGAVYKILNYAPLQSKAELHFSDLPDILGETYPLNTHLYIIEVMQKFERCFDIDGHVGERFLIPDLLPAQEPKLDAYKKGLKLEYHYDFLPRSVISHFMVRMRRFIFEANYWRNGVILLNNSNRALVKAVPEDQKIMISIVGDPPNRKNLLALICHHFDSIHQKLDLANPKARVPLSQKESVTVSYDHLRILQKKSYTRFIPEGYEEEVNVRELLEGVRPDPKSDEQKKAVRKLAEYLEYLEQGMHPQKYYRRILELGKMHHEWKEYTLARQALSAVHKAGQKLRGLLTTGDDLIGLAEESAKLYELLVHCYLKEEQKTKAFEYAAIGKGRTFVKKLAEIGFELLLIETSHQEFVKTLKEARQLRQQIKMIENNANLNQIERRTQQQELLRKESNLWQEMAHLNPTLTATLSAPTLDVEQAKTLAQTLEATLVEYYRHAEGWSAFIVTPNGVECVLLESLNDNLIKELLKWTRRVENPIGRGRLPSPRRLESLDNLHRAVILPLLQHLPKDKPIILAPFGQLHLLPLAAARNSEGRYFAESYTLTFVPSLTALYVAHEQAQKPKEELESNSEAKPLLSVAYPGTGDNYLHNVSREAQYIAQLFQPSELIQDEEATPQEIITKARDRRILHLSCHGEFDRQKPEQSGLMLAKEWLTIQDIITKLHLKQTQLVTLAACRSGQVAVRKGEEHVGLLQAMMTAGAKSVVASLWRVDDEATSDLFVSFYEYIASGKSPAISIRQAAQKVRQNPRTKHPYYWAAFQVNGLAYQPVTPGLIKQVPQDAEAIASGLQRSKGDQSMDLENIVDSADMLLEDMKEHHTNAMSTLSQEQQAQVAKALVNLSEEAIALQTESELWDVAYKLHRLVEEYPALVEEHPEGMGIQRFGSQNLANASKNAAILSGVVAKQPQVDNDLMEDLREEPATTSATSADLSQPRDPNGSRNIIQKRLTILHKLFRLPY